MASSRIIRSETEPRDDVAGSLLVLAPDEVGSEVLTGRDVERVGETGRDRGGQGDQEPKADEGADQGV